MILPQYLKKENVFIADTFEDTDAFYTSYAAFLKEKGVIEDSDAVKRLFVKRENVHTTAVGKGAATPHIYSSAFKEFIFSIALIRDGLDFKAPDKEKVSLVFLIMSDDRDVSLHLKALSQIGKLIRNTNIVQEATKTETPEELFNLISTKAKDIEI